MSSDLIASDAALADLCRALEGSAWIALDTEFLRERTYYARLCLIQIGARNRCARAETPISLADLCRALEGSAWIALDTEFLRERTYYARLCLIQIGARNRCARAETR